MTVKDTLIEFSGKYSFNYKFVNRLELDFCSPRTPRNPQIMSSAFIQTVLEWGQQRGTVTRIGTWAIVVTLRQPMDHFQRVGGGDLF